MDQHRARNLTHALAAAPSRRGVLRGLAGAGLGCGAARLPAIAEAEKRRKPKAKPCGPCQTRRKGRCRAKPDGARCRECGSCRGGVCAPDKVSCGPCRECDDAGFCVVKQDDASCGANGKCLEGICNERPTCTAAGAQCGKPEIPSCCSGICQVIIADARFCLQGAAGAECYDGNDCQEGVTCVGHRCG